MKIANNEELPSEAKERILQFVDSLVQTWNFTGELAYRSFSKEHLIKEENLKKIGVIEGKLLEVREERMSNFMS